MYPIFSDIFINDYDSRFFHKTEITPKRITSDYEIEFYTTENGFSYVNDKIFPHKKGNILFARPGNKRYSKGQFSCLSVHFFCEDKSVAENLFSKIPTCCYLPEAEPLFKELCEIPSKPKNAELVHAHAVILQIIAKIQSAYIHTDMEETSIKNAAVIKKVCDLIKENHTQSDLSIDSLYKDTFMSRSSFFSLFKTVTGLTPSTYINSVRTEHAKKLLQSTDKSLSYIAMECGFASQSYFCSVFRTQTNMTPSAYRNAFLAEIKKRYR